MLIYTNESFEFINSVYMNKNLEVEFDRIFINYGGSLELRQPSLPKVDNSIESLQIIILNLQRSNPALPTPYVSIINSYEVNAIVRKEGDIYFIGLFYGTLLLLYEIFRRMLANPNVLVEAGESAKEQLSKKILNAQYTNFEHFFNAVMPAKGSMPIDPVRAELANYLASEAIMFLLLHEYGHIVNGHVDALNSLQPKKSFEEQLANILSTNSEVEISHIMFRQTCEYDADAWANNILLQFIKARVSGAAIVSTLIQFVRESHEAAIYYYNFAIYVYWRLFGMEYENGRNLLHSTHPPSGIRQHFIMALIHTIFESYGIEYANKIGMQCSSSLFEAEKAFNEISERGFNPLGITTTYKQKAHTDHIEILSDNWTNVRPILEPYAYVKLAPIQPSIRGKIF
jgi:hypothetical protein